MRKFRDLLSLFWARSKFNSFAMFDPLMANDGSLKSWDQAEFVLGLLVGSRDNYKNELLVHGKQTVQHGLGTYVISALISALFGFGFVGIIISKPWPLMLIFTSWRLELCFLSPPSPPPPPFASSSQTCCSCRGSIVVLLGLDGFLLVCTAVNDFLCMYA